MLLFPCNVFQRAALLCINYSVCGKDSMLEIGTYSRQTTCAYVCPVEAEEIQNQTLMSDDNISSTYLNYKAPSFL